MLLRPRLRASWPALRWLLLRHPQRLLPFQRPLLRPSIHCRLSPHRRSRQAMRRAQPAAGIGSALDGWLEHPRGHVTADLARSYLGEHCAQSHPGASAGAYCPSLDGCPLPVAELLCASSAFVSFWAVSSNFLASSFAASSIFLAFASAVFSFCLAFLVAAASFFFAFLVASASIFLAFASATSSCFLASIVDSSSRSLLSSAASCCFCAASSLRSIWAALGSRALEPVGDEPPQPLSVAQLPMRISQGSTLGSALRPFNGPPVHCAANVKKRRASRSSYQPGRARSTHIRADVSGDSLNGSWTTGPRDDRSWDRRC